MRVARILCAAFALTLLAGWATSSSACDNHKCTKATASAATKVTAVAASSKGAACSAEMAAKCTPEMMAACKANASTAAAHGSCAAKGTKVSAAFVSANEADHCGAAKAGSAKGTSTAANRPATSNTIYLAGSNGSCGSKGTKASSASAGSCSGHGMASMAATSGHADCEACVDMADCSGQLDAAGAHRQAVRLKNGIMYVYTADSPRTVSAVQAAVSRRAERIIRFASAGEKTRLCAECKTMRGAMASGKLTREVVNIEGGSLTLVTSTDPSVVAKIHAMADDKVATRVKS